MSCAPWASSGTAGTRTMDALMWWLMAFSMLSTAAAVGFIVWREILTED